MCNKHHLGLVAVIALAGCNAPARDPLPYSPNYQYIGGAQSSTGVIRKGYAVSSASERRLVPDACVTPDITADPFYLPPGCANNVNLQQMVANQGDLLRGTTTGSAMAAPAARAARKVIDGEQELPEPLPGDTLSTTEQRY